MNETKEQFLLRMMMDGLIYQSDGKWYAGSQEYLVDAMTIQELKDIPRRERRIFMHGRICTVSRIMRYQEENQVSVGYRLPDGGGREMVKYLDSFVLVPSSLRVPPPCENS